MRAPMAVCSFITSHSCAIELAGLEEDGVRYADLAHVVHGAGGRQHLGPRRPAGPRASRKHGAVAADAADVGGGALVLVLGGHGQALHGVQVGLLGLALGVGGDLQRPAQVGCAVVDSGLEPCVLRLTASWASFIFSREATRTRNSAMSTGLPMKSLAPLLGRAQAVLLAAQAGDHDDGQVRRLLSSGAIERSTSKPSICGIMASSSTRSTPALTCPSPRARPQPYRRCSRATRPLRKAARGSRLRHPPPAACFVTPSILLPARPVTCLQSLRSRLA